MIPFRGENFAKHQFSAEYKHHFLLAENGPLPLLSHYFFSSLFIPTLCVHTLNLFQDLLNAPLWHNSITIYIITTLATYAQYISYLEFYFYFS